jgi:hypothetical protein
MTHETRCTNSQIDDKNISDSPRNIFRFCVRNENHSNRCFCSDSSSFQGESELIAERFNDSYQVTMPILIDKRFQARLDLNKPDYLLLYICTRYTDAYILKASSD